MAIYRCSISCISRGQGRTVVGAAAYRSGEELTCEYTGLTHDYRNKHYIDKKDILLPNNAPPEWADRGSLWNAVEKIERSKDAKLATEVMVVVPRELNKEEREQLIYDFCDDLRIRGNIVDYAIHVPPAVNDLKQPIDEFGNPTNDPAKMSFNPHAHIMLPIRPLAPNGQFIKSKATAEYICRNTETGEIRNLTQSELGDNPKFEKQFPCIVNDKKVYLTESEMEARNIKRINRFPLKTRFGRPDKEYAYRMSTDYVNDIRKLWEQYANAALKRAGIEERIDSRSYKEQGSNKIAQPHLGPIVTQMERRVRRLEYEGKDVPSSIRSDIAEIAKEIRKHNHMIDVYEKELKETVGYADKLASIKKLWISEKCHAKQLEESIRKLTTDIEFLDDRLSEFHTASSKLQSRILDVSAKKEALKNQLEATSIILLPARKKLSEQITSLSKDIDIAKTELDTLKRQYGYTDPTVIIKNTDALNSARGKLSEFEALYAESQKKVSELHNKYFELKKLVPVKIRKTVYVQSETTVSADISDGFAAFGQLYITMSRTVQREVEEEEYREVRS